MKRVRHRQLILAGWMLALAGFAVAEVFTFDPIAGVRSVVLTIESNHLQDNGWVGAREIGFERVAGEPAFIQPDSGSTDGGTFNKTDYAVENLWNEGVTAGTDTIDANAPNAGNGFASANPPLAGYPVSITLEFSTAQELSAFYLWNASSGGLSVPLSHGIKQFDLEFFDGARGTGKSLGTLTDLQAAQAPQSGNYPVELVDPRFPAEYSAISHEALARWPRSRIQQLEIERERLLAKISVLPQHAPEFLIDHLGYHSLFEEPASDGSLPSQQIDIKLSFPPSLDSIALAPAFTPPEFNAYAFPKRFKIEVLNARTDRFETVVDWMEEDFPDPGPYPVFFSGINRYVRQVRITVPQVVRESGVAHYALGEIYLFQSRPDGHIGANASTWGRGITEVSVSDPFTMYPLWDIQYLHDGMAGFGLPLSDETVSAEDLMVTYEHGASVSDKVQFILDLGHVKSIGRIDIWPAAAPHLLALPLFGFPKEISVEISPDSDFKVARVLGTRNISKRTPHGNLLSIIGGGHDARYIRITVSGLGEYKGTRVLGIGEIMVSSNGEVWSVGCKVDAQGIPEEYLDQLSRLVDGYSQHRWILPQGEWIKGLAQRRPLDRRLVVVERELELARANWRRIKQYSGIWGGGVVVMCLIGGLVLQRQLRKRGMNKLKWRIARDLHDEVGSDLGSISLAAEQLKHAVANTDAEENLRDLSLLTSEACASLREVVWVVDENTVRLPLLIQKLVERAKRVLNEMEVLIEISEDCPDRVVSFAFKRHLIMFFKEAVHNCARHSGATRVWVDFSIVDQSLRISIRDNGCGFDPLEPSEGWGLDSMKERAEELGGKMELITQVGAGTTIVLKTSLTTLSRELYNVYKTSN